MEILQTIWTALTNENEFLVNTLIVPFAFVEAYILMLVYSTLLNVDLTKKQKFLFITILAISGMLNTFIIPAPYNAFINYISIFLTVYFTFRANILKTIACLFVPIIFSAIIESIFIKVLSVIFNIDYLTIATIPLYRLILFLLVYSVWLALILLIKYFKINFSKLQVLNKKKRFLLIFTTIVGVILIGLQLYMMTVYATYLPFLIIILNMIILIVYFGISLYTTFTTSELETASANLEEAQLYNKTLEILHDSTRAFRHDLTNILVGMTGYIDRNDMEGLKKYHEQLMEDIKQTNNLTTLSPKVVNNPAVYNVLANKYYKADNLGIKINLEVFIDLNDLHMKIYEFTRVLGILMDNAIEASNECEEKLINVSIRKDNRKHMQLLIIENTYSNKNIDTEKIYEKGYTTKEGNTGLGLWEIRQILKKNNNLNLFTKKDDKFFTQQFEIFY